MKPDADGFFYRDQRTAEDRVDELRANRRELLEALKELNVSIDSLALHKLIETEEWRAI